MRVFVISHEFLKCLLVVSKGKKTQSLFQWVTIKTTKPNAASELSDISVGFDVVCKDNVLTVPDTNMLSVLKKYHNTVDVEIPDAGMIKAVINTALVITSESRLSIILSFVFNRWL